MVYGVERLSDGGEALGRLEGLYAVFLVHAIDVLLERAGELHLLQRMGEGDDGGGEVEAPDVHVALLHEVAHLPLVAAVGVFCLPQGEVLALQLQIHAALAGDVADGDDVVDDIAVFVSYGVDDVFYVFVEAQLRIAHVLAGMVDLPAVGVEVAFHHVEVEERCLKEELLGILGDAAQLAHLVVEVDEIAVLVVERDGKQAGVEHFAVAAGQLALLAFFSLFLGDVACGDDDVGGPSMLVEFGV